MRGIFKILAIAVIVAAVITSTVFIIEENNRDKSTDYSDQGNWMYAQTDATHEVDLFYIYPTVSLLSDRDDGCANITDTMKIAAKGAFAETGYAFAGYTNVFAPYYRQVALDKAAEMGDHDSYFDCVKNSVAAQDIYSALDYYFEHYNNGRPFMLAGHSQGSCMVLVVLENYMSQHPEYYSRMIAAYAIGFGVTQDYLDRNTHLKFANSATDTGVIISWNTEGIPEDGVYKPSLVIGENCQVINPLTWSRSTEYVDKSANRGEYKLLEDGSVTTVAGVNDAQINATRGSLICTTNTSFTPGLMMGDVSLHGKDYSLYFRDIQINGFDRITAYLGHRPMTGVALDYSDDSNWMLKDHTTGTGKQTVDVFYVYPTGTDPVQTIVCDVTDDLKKISYTSYLMNASAFSDYTNIYAPYYRQISSYGLLQAPTADGIMDSCAREVTRTDVYAALDYYFENCNDGRPFILAGHSQGSAILKLVLSEYMKMEEHQAYMQRMVAAYAIGFQITEDWLEENDLTFASSATDSGVVITWNTYGTSIDAGANSILIGEGGVSINPLSWTVDYNEVDASENAGSIYVDSNTQETQIIPGIAGAKISQTLDGAIISDVNSSLFPSSTAPLIGKDNYHNADWALFHESIKQNGKDRIAAYFTDYSKSENWMYAQTDAVHEVDLFYIYPTVMLISDRADGCANITDTMKIASTGAFAETGYAFAGYTNVFAPYYRQVALDKAAEMTDHDDYFDYVKNSIAAQDIYDALDYYFEHYNNGRPFMIAGHSQGSCMTLVVLENYMSQHPEYYSRMIAAYAIGFGVTQEYLDRNTHLKFADSATDTGVIVSWNTEGIPADGVYKPSLVIGENCQVINPLTWSRSTEYVDKSANRGEYKLLDDGSVTTVAGVNDAQINATRGSLICTTNTSFTPGSMMGDVSLHGKDYALYFRDIQINGFDRIEAYLGHRTMTGVAMDYSDSENWMYSGYTTGDGEQTADVFYLYPTSAFSDSKIVGEVDASMKSFAGFSAQLNVLSMAGYTNIYAPYYRQITSYGIGQCDTAEILEDLCAREVTRTDIYAALDYYFENCNDGRPFILAGHSQGSANLKAVLSEYMKMEEHQAYMQRMVAAYLIGFEITEDWLEENDLTFASSATDTGVIISWNTYSDAEDSGEGSKLIGEGCVAINPLSWSRDTVKVDKSQNECSLYVDVVTHEETTYTHVASAQLSETVGGMVITSIDSGTLFETSESDSLGKNSYHNNDWSLFFDSIRQNGQDRIAAYFAK